MHSNSNNIIIVIIIIIISSERQIETKYRDNDISFLFSVYYGLTLRNH